MTDRPELEDFVTEQAERSEEIDSLRLREETRAVRTVLQTYLGRAFVWALMETAGTEQGVFVGEAPLSMAWTEGRRSIGQWTRDWVFTAAPETYMMMRTEAAAREQRYADAAGLETEPDEE